MTELRGSGMDRPEKADAPDPERRSDAEHLMAAMLKSYPDDPRTLRFTPDSEPVDLFPKAEVEKGHAEKVEQPATEKEAADNEAADNEAADGEEADEGKEAKEAPKGWDAPGVADHEKRPDREAINLDAERRTHILDGEPDSRNGGHRHGTGRAGKSEFPEEWDDDRIVSAVVSVARDPETAEFQFNGRWKTTGQRDEVTILVAVRPDGAIVTGFPLDGPGVVRNPPEDT